MTAASSQSVVNRFVAAGLFRFVIWYAVIYPLVVAGITIGLRYVNDGGDDQLWRNLTIAPVYYLVACGAVAAATMLPMIVAHGRTRGAYARAAVPLFVALAIITGLYVVAMIGLDLLISNVAGWERTISGAVPFASFGDVIDIFIDTTLAGLSALATGWLGGIVWQSAILRRPLGWIPAVLLTVPAALPLIAADIVLDRPPYGADLADSLGLSLSPAAGAIAAVVVAAAGLAVAATLTRAVIVGGRPSPA